MRFCQKFLWLTFLSVPALAKAKENSMPLSFDVKLSYGQDFEDPANKIPVLIYEYTIKNNSENTVSFSTWQMSIGLKSLSPSSAVVTYTTAQGAGLGMPSGPTPDQLVTLKPQQELKLKRWYWAKSDLVWPNEDGKTGYALKKDSRLTLVFCADFRDDRAAFPGRIKKDLPFVTGKFCAPPMSFDFKILMKDE
jgi:hypothetical protein